MADQTKDVPNQRGTSSGEIGQNPVEMRYKEPQDRPNDTNNNEPKMRKPRGVVSSTPPPEPEH